MPKGSSWRSGSAVAVAELLRAAVVRVAQVAAAPGRSCRRGRRRWPRRSRVITAFDLGASASAIMAWARLSRASGMPISCTACAAATAVGQRGRVGQPDVLAGQDDQPAGDEPGVLARLDHPGQVVQGGVDVASRGPT